MNLYTCENEMKKNLTCRLIFLSTEASSFLKELFKVRLAEKDSI